jgi:hypothetical protein
MGKVAQMMRIAKRVAEIYEMDASEFLFKCKQQLRVKAGSIFCFWSVKKLGMSLRELARQLEISPPAAGYCVERGEAIAREKGYRRVDFYFFTSVPLFTAPQPTARRRSSNVHDRVFSKRLPSRNLHRATWTCQEKNDPGTKIVPGSSCPDSPRAGERETLVSFQASGREGWPWDGPHADGVGRQEAGAFERGSYSTHVCLACSGWGRLLGLCVQGSGFCHGVGAEDLEQADAGLQFPEGPVHGFL